MERETLAARVAALPWFHTIDLGDGLHTPGVDLHTAARCATYGLPADLRGRMVLDLGAWDGFFSFEAERRGAARVVAVDAFSWGGGGWGSKDAFLLAREILGSRVEDVDCDLLDVTPATVGGVFDLVLCLGVLYHMQHPLRLLAQVASVTQDQLILETHVDLLDMPRPAMAFYPGAELNGDASNWWGPNPACVQAMLATVGFARSTVHALTPLVPLDLPSARLVVHAWRH